MWIFRAPTFWGVQRQQENFENWSQEFQLFGSTDSVDWLFGAYIYTEDISSNSFLPGGEALPIYVTTLLPAVDPTYDPVANRDNLLAAIAGLPIAPEEYESESDGWSLFTHNTWHVTDIFDITLGLRYSDEDKDAESIQDGAAPGTFIDRALCDEPVGPSTTFKDNAFGFAFCENPSFKGSRSEDELTGTLKFGLAVTEDVNIYFGYSRGYKAGGFNLDNEAIGNRDSVTGEFIDGTEFEPELSDALELGFKGNFLDGTLTVNAAAFYTKFDDFQLNTFTGLGFFIANVSEAVSQGVEVESFWMVADGISLTLGATYADARYGDDLGIDNAAIQALEGRRVTQSPLWQGSAAIFVDRQLPGTDMRYTFNLNMAHIGSANTGSNLDKNKVRGSYNIFNSNIGLRAPDDTWEVQLWSRNLTDKRVKNLVFDSVFQSGSYSVFYNTPRMYGVTVSYNFGGQ